VIFFEGGAADDPQAKLMQQITGAVADNANIVFMQSHTAKVAISPALWRRGAPHYPALNSDAFAALEL